MTRPYIVSFDFDGTVTLNDDAFPEPGPERPEAVRVLQGFTRHPKVALLLNTCREGLPLEMAIDWLNRRNIAVDASNESVPWVKCRTRKPRYDIHICDKNFPRVPEGHNIDWNALEAYVYKRLETWAPDEDHPFYAGGGIAIAEYKPYAEIESLQKGYEALDANWDKIHNMAVDAIRDALGMTDATIPEMVLQIRILREEAGA